MDSARTHITPTGGLTAEQALAAVRRAATVAAELPTPPCPQWCGDKPGHAWDADGITGAAVRIHGLIVDTYQGADDYVLTVSLNQTDYRDEAGDITAEPVTANVDGELSTTDPADLRQLARAAVQAAVILAEIQGQPVSAKQILGDLR
jgi:hypothetical protein